MNWIPFFITSLCKTTRVNEINSDLETENQLLRQQALLNSESRRMSGHLTGTPELSENGDQEDENVSPMELGTEPDRQLSRSQNERQRESLDTLIKCVSGYIGFSEGKPVAAFTIYKVLLYWKSFEAEKTNVFDRLIQMIGSSIEGWKAGGQCPILHGQGRLSEAH